DPWLAGTAHGQQARARGDQAQPRGAQLGARRVSEPIRAPLPPRAPRHGNALTRWIGRSVLRLGGWRVEGEWPDVDQLLIIAAPHSSAWDGIWGLAAKLALGVELRIMAKA